MKPKLVWYASYGSNLCEGRFKCYIQGGTPEGSEMEEQGCQDKTPPRAVKNLIIPYSLYFAGRSERWGGGGMGFISREHTRENPTLGRMYLITEQQFKEVVKQENRMYRDQIKDYDLKLVKRKGSMQILAAGYGLIVYLGSEKRRPIFTFTTPDSNRPRRTPSLPYLKMFAKGYQEAYGMDKETVIHHLLAKDGIKGIYTPQDLQAIFL